MTEVKLSKMFISTDNTKVIIVLVFHYKLILFSFDLFSSNSVGLISFYDRFANFYHFSFFLNT